MIPLEDEGKRELQAVLSPRDETGTHKGVIASTFPRWHWQGRIFRGMHLRASHSTYDHPSPSQAGPELLQKLSQRM